MTSGPIKSRQILTDLDLRNNTIYDANIPYKQHYYEYETSLDNISGAKEGDIAKIEETDKIIYYKYHNGAWVLIQDPDTELSETSTNTVQNQAVTKVILDNEKVVAAMGNDLNDRILNIDNEISTINTNVETITPLVEITYADLKTLRDTNKLVPGKQYRITDYQCTTTQTNTRSAGHQFDIIVTAISNNSLSEDASAINHEGDTYFSSCNLNIWKLRYSIDNSTSKFAWASSSGKGVIYYMQDEYGNSASYDFKNIQFIPYNPTAVTYYTYTFNSTNADAGTDNSLNNSNVADNTINPFINGALINLNCISIIGSAKSNHFDTNCRNITIISSGSSNSRENTFGCRCQKIILLGNNVENTFKCSCSTISIGTTSQRNKFLNNAINITIGNNSDDNNFLENCTADVLGDSCDENKFDNDSSNNNIGSYINKSVFGCSGVTLTAATAPTLSAPLTNLIIKHGVTGSVVSQVTNQSYQWTIAKDSNGNIVQYCEDDITVGKGTTTERPAGKTVGYQYFDTTLNKPIWYTGTAWVDSTGATV